MCRSPLHPFLAALPKCEHHMHLEGSLSPSLLFTLAAQNRIPLPTSDPAFASPSALLARYTTFASLDDFLHYYFIGMSVLLHASDFERLAWEYFLRAKADGVVHAEVFFDPQAHTGRGVAYDTVVEGFTKACQRAEQELGITTGLILCFLRHLSATEAEKTFELAYERGHFHDGVLMGMGLDSSEVGFPPRLFQQVYAMGERKGVRLTAHAGEEGGPESVREAVEKLRIERIDHGIRMAADKMLMREVAGQGMLVTVCPLSNVRLRCVRHVGELPIQEFLQEEVKFSLNSDDPAYFGGYILDNYCAVQEAFGLSVETWVRIAENSIEGSWCGRERKEQMRMMLEEVGKRYEHLE